ncbi:Hint domain-containing protein [Tropicimonas sp. IMCC6043]|uniref:Hint domain-containing protein n=1 Tax=Tropicimonas sp. IMCC6043 TaxID=2510645 RepID=UPI00101B7A73|nr:Hint domain-containing protein [Tropicimonas sp. IMCC6043]RYH12068.1 hypothetical protein EU800_00405 [Tropicimonas sp. IMCC6043]
MHIPFVGTALRRRPILVDSAPDTGLVGTTCLYTENGPIPAMLIAPGDQVIRRGRGPVQVLDVRFESYAERMVRIAPGTLGRARPEDFMLLPPGQRIHLRFVSGVARDAVCEVRDLIDNDRVTWHLPEAPVQLVKLGFGTREIIHAGGLELEIGGAA